MKKNMFEALLYGALSMMFGMMFFFGLMYPTQTMRSDVLKVTKPIVYEGVTYDAKTFETMDAQHKMRMISQMNPEQIRIKSAFITYIKR